MDIVYSIVKEELKIKGVRVVTPDVIMDDWEKYATERNFDWWDKTQIPGYGKEALGGFINWRRNDQVV